MTVIPYLAVLLLCVLRVHSNVYETHQHIERAGYVAETHNVVTEDGYILEMHRIPFRRGETSGEEDRPVVFCLHGLLGASISFISLGRHYAIGYNLADAGYDVWLGNARGNRNSRHHVSLDPDVDRLEFFDFTWNEIGMYDVPTMIDYILDYTSNQRLHYIGHSQGGTAFLVMTSTRPEYNRKIGLAHLLAPAGYKTYFPNAILRPLTPLTDVLWSLLVRIGITEVFPPNPIMPFSENDTTEDLELWQYCTGDPKYKDFCILTGVEEIMENTYTDDGAITGMGYSGGASFKQIAHYGQNIRDDSFRKWNYGTTENIAQYGTKDPPAYNLSLITANVTMHYTISDTLVGVNDVYAMAENMPSTSIRRVLRDSFRHGDFIGARDVRELVTVYIIDTINNYNETYVEPEPEPEDDEDDSASSIVLCFAMKMYLIIITLYHCVY